MCIFIISSVWESGPEEKGSVSICPLPSGICPQLYLSPSPSLTTVVALSPNEPESRAVCIVQMKWAGLWVCSEGRRKSWQRGQRWRSTHPDCGPTVTSGRTGESPETWIDFFESEGTQFQISVDLPWWNVSKTEKDFHWQLNDISRENETKLAAAFQKCHCPAPTVQLPLWTLQTECELLNYSATVPLMSITLYFECIHSPCVKTLKGYLCFLAISHTKSAASL